VYPVQVREGVRSVPTILATDRTDDGGGICDAVVVSDMATEVTPCSVHLVTVLAVEGRTAVATLTLGDGGAMPQPRQLCNNKGS